MSKDLITFEDVFKPNDTPSISYVSRSDLKLESNLHTYMSLPKMVVSISGPSKSGKTVLIKKVLDNDLIIPVIGSGITSAQDLWNRALRWMEVPVRVTKTKSSGTQIKGSVKGGGEAGIPLVAKGKAEACAEAGRDWAKSEAIESEEAGLPRVIKEVSESDFVIFIDDFHYIDVSIREEIGRQIKIAADNGVKVLTASVPHRSDDVVRSNPELRGRVAALDLGYWENRHLKQIAEKGFSALNCELSNDVVLKLASEAMGSPQLMQTMCFCLCKELGVLKPQMEHHRIEVSKDQFQNALRQTSHFADFSKMLTSLHSGPRTRGQERKVHQFVDGSSGDVYRAVLLAMRSNPISMSFTYDDILTRVKSVCRGESPVGSSVTSCLEQMHTITEDLQPGLPVMAWDGDNLDVSDPYFAFFLRSSEKIHSIQK